MDSASRNPFGVAELKQEVSRLKAVLSVPDSDDEYSESELEKIGLSNNISHETADFPFDGLFPGCSSKTLRLPNFASLEYESIVKSSLDHSQHLKDMISKALRKIERYEEDLCVKEKYLETKLALSVRLEVEEKKKIKYYKPINLFATPYFRDARKSVPSPNEDSLIKRMNQDIDAYTLPPKPWTNVEHQSLRSSVIGTAKVMLMDPLITRQEYYKDRLENGAITPEQASETKEKLRNILEEIQNVEDMSVDELLKLAKPLDWMRIATAMHPSFSCCATGGSTPLRQIDNHRTPEECERMWNNYLHPWINKKKWTPEEDKELEKVAKRYNYTKWSIIASKLKLSKRTAIQCLERHQSTLNKSMQKSAWTAEDDEELARVVEMCKVGDYIPWNQVQYHIDGRSRLQILNRWTRAIAPDLKKSPWSSQEDAILIAAVEKYGYHWTKIHELLPGRSNFSCRERYMNVLLPDTTVGNWSPEEDRTLVKLVKQYGETKWSRIASYLPGRTDNMCLTRFTRIKKHHPHLFEESDPLGTDIEAEIDQIRTPTHNCKRLNSHRLAVRSTAETNMLETVMRIKGYTSQEKAMADLGGPKTSYAFLRTLSKELLGEQQNSVERKLLSKMPQRSRESSEGSNAVRSPRSSLGESHAVRSPRSSLGESHAVRSSRRSNIRSSNSSSRWSDVTKSSRPLSQGEDLFQSTDSDSSEESFVSDSSDDDVEMFESDMDIDEEGAGFVDELSADLDTEIKEREMVELKLDSLLMPFVSHKIGAPSRFRGQCDSVKSILQNSQLKAYIYKQLQVPCEAVTEDTNYRGVDYGVSVPLVCKKLVCEASSEGRLPIMPPNPVTLEAMKYLLINRKALINSREENPCDNFSTLSVITSHESYKLVCSSCYVKYGYESETSVIVNLPSAGSRENMNGMDNESGPDPSFHQCKVEPGTSNSNGSCPECERLNLLREMYHLLRRRVFSTFICPAMLTCIKPTEEQRVNVLGQTRSQPVIAKSKWGRKRKKNTQLNAQKKKRVKLAMNNVKHARKRAAKNSKIADKKIKDKKKVPPLASRRSSRRRK